MSFETEQRSSSHRYETHDKRAFCAIVSYVTQESGGGVERSQTTRRKWAISWGKQGGRGGCRKSSTQHQPEKNPITPLPRKQTRRTNEPGFAIGAFSSYQHCHWCTQHHAHRKPFARMYTVCFHVTYGFSLPLTCVRITGLPAAEFPATLPVALKRVLAHGKSAGPAKHAISCKKYPIQG